MRMLCNTQGLVVNSEDVWKCYRSNPGKVSPYGNQGRCNIHFLACSMPFLLCRMMCTEFIYNRQTFKISKGCRSNKCTFYILSRYRCTQTSSTRKPKRSEQSQLWRLLSKGTQIPGSCAPVVSVTLQGRPVMVFAQMKLQRSEKTEREKKRSDNMVNDKKSHFRQLMRFQSGRLKPWGLNRYWVSMLFIVPCFLTSHCQDKSDIRNWDADDVNHI